MVYKVRARNTSADSDNKIHDDQVAASYGFRGGLVPGVTVYAYMTVPLVERFAEAWLERGSMQVKFHLPFYDGDEAIIRTEVDAGSLPIKATITAEREDGTVCATALATIDDRSAWLGPARLEDYPEGALPDPDARPVASPENIQPGMLLGTVREKLDLRVVGATWLPKLDERLEIYRGPDAVAYPFVLLVMANHALMSNFKLGPWIHAATDLINWSAARDGEELAVRGRVRDRFERKGHEFVVLDLLVVANGERVVQQVRHTAIYRPRQR